MSTPTTKRFPASIRLTLLVCVVALAAGYVGGQMGRDSQTAEAQLPDRDAPSSETVTAERGDVVATLSIEGYVGGNSLFTIEAPAGGLLSHAALRRNDSVAKSASIATVDGIAVSVPVDATFVRWLAASGTVVPEGLPLAEFRLNGFGIAAEISGYAQYRLFSDVVHSRGIIHEGPGPFDCQILQLPSDSQGDEGGQAARPFTCVVPHDVRVFDGVKASVMLEGEQATNVVLVPVGAVSGTVDRGDVMVVGADGAKSLRSVELGVTDGLFVEIKSGLEEGERITATAPLLVGDEK